MTEKMTISNVLGHVNQFEVDFVWTGKRYFYSYNSLCCVLNFAEQRIVLGRDWDYSRTTLKHLYAFLWDNYFGNLADKKTIQKAIEDWKFEDWDVKYDAEMK